MTITSCLLALVLARKSLFPEGLEQKPQPGRPTAADRVRIRRIFTANPDGVPVEKE